jgi:hypothetical protein
MSPVNWSKPGFDGRSLRAWRGPSAPLLSRARCREHFCRLPLDRSPLEEPWVDLAPEAHRIRKGEVAEVVGGDEAALHELSGLRQHPPHVGHVEVTDVGAECGIEARAEGVHATVERPRVEGGRDARGSARASDERCCSRHRGLRT